MLHKIDVIHQDKDIIVVNKPSGLLSMEDGYDSSLPHVRNILEPDLGKLWLVHRLDKQTSGVMVLARNADAHRTLNEQFGMRLVIKEYHLIVYGAPEWQVRAVTAPLRTNTGRKNRTKIDYKQGKQASTRFQVMEIFSDHALLSAEPRTGRRHQIRAHINHLGYPVVGDNLYNSGMQHDQVKIAIDEDVMMLHAAQLRFVHPTTDKLLTITTPYPEHFATYLGALNS